MIAPVAGSGAWPAWMPRVAKPRRLRGGVIAAAPRLAETRGEEGAHLRPGEAVGDRVRRALVVHEAVIGLGIVLHDGRRLAPLQALLQAEEGVVAGDVVAAGIEELHGAGDVAGDRHRVVRLVRRARLADRGINRGAGLDPAVARGQQEHEPAAEAEADRADMLDLELGLE